MTARKRLSAPLPKVRKRQVTLKEYEQFFKKIAKLTLDHGVINDTACITAAKLGEALETIDEKWYEL